MRIVGLTGGIASGKSTVGRLLAERGIPVIDADRVARVIVEPGSPGLAALVEHFGANILDATGGLDRAAMRTRITGDEAAREHLNAVTHPAIRAHIGRWLQEQLALGAEIAIVEAALLVETGSHTMYPELVVVSCGPERQLERLMERDKMTESEARALVATQLPLAEKEAVATYVIHNDSTHAALKQAVITWIEGPTA